MSGILALLQVAFLGKCDDLGLRVHGVGHSPVCQILLQIVMRAVITSSPPAWTSSAGMCRLQLTSLSSMNPGHTSSLILGRGSGATGFPSETSLKYQQRTHTQSQHRQQPLHQTVTRDVNRVNRETPRTVHLQQHQEQ